MSLRNRGSVRIQIGDTGFETGIIATQADGSVLARQGNAVVLAAVVTEQSVEERSFLPLTVDYREKLAGGGRIPGGYFKREARSTEHEILTSRLIDRSLRPLFPQGFRNETQVVATVLSHDPKVDPRTVAMNAASCALSISGVPWAGPTISIRVVLNNGTYVSDPTPMACESAQLDLITTFGQHGLVMLEGAGREVEEDEIIGALEYAREKTESMHQGMLQFIEDCGGKKNDYHDDSEVAELTAALEAFIGSEIDHAFTTTGDKRSRRALIQRATCSALDKFETGYVPNVIERHVSSLVKRHMRKHILSGNRADGRQADHIREISGAAGWLPGAHGSSLFTRGETQAIVTCTLGGGRDELELEGLGGAVRQRFYIHYNFPGYSVGEVRPLRGPGRREIGHGNLARKALTPVLPRGEDFPYTIRIDSEITESNGSSSMATVCAGTLALMDAGVPIRAPVAGVAMGLIAEEGSHVVLTDISGDEDHAGDMDFKVAGTREGITAIQMDNKIGSVPSHVLLEALRCARIARIAILDRMTAIIAEPREEFGSHVPRVRRIVVRPNRIRELIGAGGRTIQDLQKSFGVRLEVAENGMVTVHAADEEHMEPALKRIEELTGHAVVGEHYDGTVMRILDFGVFVNLFGSIDGFLPISEIKGAGLTQGGRITVCARGVDSRGRILLSLENPEARTI